MPKDLPWLRILVEAAVIVVSILLAFGIDAWWGRKQEAQQLQETLASLEAGFVENVERVDEQLDISDDFRARLDVFFAMSPSAALGMPEDSADLLVTAVYRPVISDLNNDYLSALLDAADLSRVPTMQEEIALWRRTVYSMRERRAVLVQIEQDLLRVLGRYPEMGPHLRRSAQVHTDASALALLRDDPEVVALATTKAQSWIVYRSYFVRMRSESESILGFIQSTQAQ